MKTSGKPLSSLIEFVQFVQILPYDIVCYHEFKAVENNPGEVTDEEDDDNTDKNTGQVDLTLGLIVSVVCHVTVPGHKK